MSPVQSRLVAARGTLPTFYYRPDHFGTQAVFFSITCLEWLRDGHLALLFYKVWFEPYSGIPVLLPWALRLTHFISFRVENFTFKYSCGCGSTGIPGEGPHWVEMLLKKCYMIIFDVHCGILKMDAEEHCVDAKVIWSKLINSHSSYAHKVVYCMTAQSWW